MNDMQPYVIRGAVAVPGANIMSHPRCGDADRQRASDRISEAYSHGFLDKQEAEARLAALDKASLAAHLEELTSDIPVMSRWRGVTLSERKQTRAKEWVKWYKARQPWIGLAGLLGGLMTGIVPTVLAYNLAGGPWVAICAAVTIPPAAVAFIGSVCSLMAWGV